MCAKHFDETKEEKKNEVIPDHNCNNTLVSIDSFHFDLSTKPKKKNKHSHTSFIQRIYSFSSCNVSTQLISFLRRARVHHNSNLTFVAFHFRFPVCIQLCIQLSLAHSSDDAFNFGSFVHCPNKLSHTKKKKVFELSLLTSCDGNPCNNVFFDREQCR